MDKIFNWLTANKSKLMRKFIMGMIPNRRDAEDFYQDLYLIMADKDLDKLMKIYDNNEMDQYMYVIIRNNLRSCHSRYYYTYRKPIGGEYLEDADMRFEDDNTEKYELLYEIEEDYQKLIDKINVHLDNQIISKPTSFYDKKIFEMYYNDENTYRGLSNMLGIPPTSIYNTVTRNRIKIVKLFKTEVTNINNKLIYYYTL